MSSWHANPAPCISVLQNNSYITTFQVFDFAIHIFKNICVVIVITKRQLFPSAQNWLRLLDHNNAVHLRAFLFKTWKSISTILGWLLLNNKTIWMSNPSITTLNAQRNVTQLYIIATINFQLVIKVSYTNYTYVCCFSSQKHVPN